MERRELAIFVQAWDPSSLGASLSAGWKYGRACADTSDEIGFEHINAAVESGICLFIKSSLIESNIG
jgi:hypothetical protein